MNTIALDRMGGIASTSCALHCLMLSLAPAVVSLLGVDFLANETCEWIFFGAALSFAVLAAGLGYRSHGSRWILAGFATGMLVLVAGRLGEALHVYPGAGVLAITGGLLLATSHLLSARHIRSCGHTDCP